MAVELRKGGLHVSGTALSLDAKRRSPLCFVSHAHSDHIARHERTIATRATVELMTHRLGELPGALPAPYARGFELGPLYLELFPAGHVLGSAQLRITREDGRRIVYTGDLNLEPALTAEKAQVLECDTLVLEATFGHPRFSFPPRAEVLEKVEAWVRRQLDEGIAPILLAYSLGKSQEITAHLESRGLSVCVHPSIHAVNALYRAHGVALSARRFEGELRPGEVGVFPPFGRSKALKRITPKRTAVLTGWANEPGVLRRYGADVAFPLSDHADFNALVRYAKQSGAEEVLCHHGFAHELAEALRQQGLISRAVGQPLQMALGL